MPCVYAHSFWVGTHTHPVLHVHTYVYVHFSLLVVFNMKKEHITDYLPKISSAFFSQ